MKFGAYARDTLQVRQYTSGGTYYDQWIGFLGCKYDLHRWGHIVRDNDMRKPLLIDLNGENPNRAQDNQRERLNEEAPKIGDAIVCSYGKSNHKLTQGGATRFGCHWLISNSDITNLPGPAVAFA